MTTARRNATFKQGRNVMITHNNPSLSPEDYANLFLKHPHFRYLVFQKEKGEDGTLHYQGYAEFNKQIKLGGLKKIDARAHYELRRGTPKQAIAYCTKEDTRVEGPWFYGTPCGSQGKRMDLIKLYDAAKDRSKPLSQVAEENPDAYLKYYKAVAHVRSLKAFDKPKLRPNLKVYLFEGPPGTGKTKAAYDMDPELFAVPIGKDLWFDGYAGEETILLDDFSGQMRLVDVLRLLDIYPVQVPIKGSFVYLHATVIIITTNVPLEDWYDYTRRKDSYEAMKRRITVFREFKEPYVPEEEETQLEDTQVVDLVSDSDGEEEELIEDSDESYMLAREREKTRKRKRNVTNVRKPPLKRQKAQFL